MSKIYETKEEYYLTFYGIHDENTPDIVFAITNQEQLIIHQFQQ